MLQVPWLTPSQLLRKEIFQIGDSSESIHEIILAVVEKMLAKHKGLPVATVFRTNTQGESWRGLECAESDLVLLRSDLADVVPCFRHYFWHTDYERW